MKPNIDNKGRAARGGLAAIFILIGLFCAFEAWRGWCAIRACGVKLPF